MPISCYDREHLVETDGVPQLSHIEECLLIIVEELSTQHNVGATFPQNLGSFSDWIDQEHEFIEHDELGIAYESLVATLEAHPFTLSARAAVKLLEVGLLLGFKTERMEDSRFDMRARGAEPDA